MKPTFVPTEYLTVRQAARMLGKAPGSIYSRIEHRTLDAVMIDGRVMLRTVDVCCALDDMMLEVVHSWGVLEVDTTPPVAGWRR
jgi:hypothetical protein